MMDFVSGWAAGIVGITVGYPFDTVKVNQQIQGSGTIQCTQTIYEQFGIRGFFRGLAFPLVASGAISSLYFGAYRVTLNTLLELDAMRTSKMLNTPIKVKPEPGSHYTYYFVSGGMSGLIQGVVLCPVELIKIRLQTTLPNKGHTNLPKLGPIRLFKDLTAEYGFRGLFKGLVPTLYRTIPGGGTYMLSYEFLSSWIPKFTSNEISRLAGVFIAGGFSGALAWCVLLPIDTVKSRIQADCSRNPKYKGFVHCAKIIYKEQGYRGFCRGLTAVSIRAFPVNGATFLTLEGFNYLFNDILKL